MNPASGRELGIYMKGIAKLSRYARWPTDAIAIVFRCVNPARLILLETRDDWERR